MFNALTNEDYLVDDDIDKYQNVLQHVKDFSISTSIYMVRNT